MRRLAALGFASALLVIVGGFAYASIPDSAGVIHACYKNSGGSLRVIDSDVGQQCAGNETALSWKQGGLNSYEIVTRDDVIPPSYTGSNVHTITCPIGKRALGGTATAQLGQTFSWGNGAFVRVEHELLTDTEYAAIFPVNSTITQVLHLAVTCAFSN